MRVVFYSPDAGRAQEWVQSMAEHDIQFEPLIWEEDQPQKTVQADYAVVWLPPESFFTSVQGLKAVFNMGAGADAILKLPTLPVELDIVRLDDQEIGQKIAEYVIHAIADITRDMDSYKESQPSQSWSPRPYTYFGDWPIGIMGLGKIGSYVASLLVKLGYPVQAWSRSKKELDGVTCFSGQAQLMAFLQSSRIVINILPLTAQTDTLFSAQTLAAMRSDSFLINIGRGEHLDEAALLAAIRNGHLAGAVLDVFRQEPLPAQHPFWQEPRIRITPHIAGATNVHLAIRQIVRKIQHYQQGQPVEGIINRSFGY